ncbi:peptidoglycan-binding domain-containing protein [Streptomyces sp. WMMC897]|uniref:peptidoglycan-binding domain-containing protein n=1 Tax=Streptomyces sp. WMMC897 TaxID=3014782 RepID=UPI0022B5F5BC|nr:peptidoglycan-binding domain-containing protein [Streptomyces sp. WMMC897]MCZ7413818.1 peptidoglycan-binding domain-containing protein [Streptomyces sp. WMMC897]
MVSITPRSAWAGDEAPAGTTDLPWRPWKGGVAIHHAGSGTVPHETRQDCLDIILDIYQKHTSSLPLYGHGYDDIGYNYLVCQHGEIFEGRGARRPEANGNAYVLNGDGEAVGANEGFYTICGLVKSDQQPTILMRDKIRELIASLRSRSSWRAGHMLMGHKQFGTSEECPGNLFAYMDELKPSPEPEPEPSPEPTGIITRGEWGARAPRSVTRTTWAERTGFTVHYSYSPATTTPRSIQNYHMDSNGWDDIGYNFLVDDQGRIYEGRGWLTVGAHATGYNTSHIGVCFIGYNGDVTGAAKNVIRGLYLHANGLAGKTLTATYHGGLPGNSTSCPGANLREWVLGGMDGLDIPIGGGGDGHSGGGDGGGMTAVRQIAAQQKAVNELGYSPPLVIDGVWGPNTDAGVRWLQNLVGVTADGLWGPATEDAYRAYVAGGGGGMTTVRSVAAQQKAVNELGYSPPLVIDGVWGPNTDAGVRWLQDRVGVTADGLWGPATESAYFGYIDGTGDLVVDGQLGPKTYAALQSQIGVFPADGVWGPQTAAALQRHLNRWYGSSLVVDGDFGTASVTALQGHLRKSNGFDLAMDGVWGTATTEALQLALNRGRF